MSNTQDTGASQTFTSSWSQVWRFVRGHDLRVKNELAEIEITPTRISLAFPKFWAGSVMCPSIEELAPRGLWGLKDDPQAFDKAYVERLDRFGVDLILERMTEAREKGGHKPLVLCCFEPYRTDCHRGLFAKWWAEQTGEVITEWDAPRVDPQTAIWDKAV